MKVQELGIEEMARTGATHRVVITYADLNGTGTGYGALSAASAAATTGTLTPFGALAAGTMSQYVGGYLKTAFNSASVTALTLAGAYDLASGTDKTTDGYQTAISVFTGVSPVSYFPQEIVDQDSSSVDATYGTQESAALTAVIAAVNQLIKAYRKVFAVANTVQIKFASTTANLSALTDGEVHLLFRLVDHTTAV